MEKLNHISFKDVAAGLNIRTFMTCSSFEERCFIIPQLLPDNQEIQKIFFYNTNEDEVIISNAERLVSENINSEKIPLNSDDPIGNYVLSGGELGAAVVVDAIGRLIPGVLNDETSALMDSYQDNLLAPPVYTRPEDFRGWKVPDVLLSGNHAKIDAWRHEESLKRTKAKRPGLLDED